jgi:hypothetical protein
LPVADRRRLENFVHVRNLLSAIGERPSHAFGVGKSGSCKKVSVAFFVTRRSLRGLNLPCPKKIAAFEPRANAGLFTTSAQTRLD